MLCAGFSLVVASRGYCLVAVLWILIIGGSFVEEHRLQVRGLQWLQHMGSVVVVHRL